MMTQAERGRQKAGRGARGARPAKAAAKTSSTEGERIAKVLARAGICSRREAEKLIGDGRVSVNGKTLTSPAVNVTVADRISVDGKALPEAEPARLWRYHKPRGLVTTHRDPEGRPTVFQRLPVGLPRVISVGRLDINTEGLLLLTNDGALARLLELPATGWLRRYRVRAHGTLAQSDLDRLKDGITVEGVHYGPIEAHIDRQQGGNVWLTIGLREGKNREIKRVLEFLNVRVNRLIRISFGPFMLGDLPGGGTEEIKTRVLREQLGEKAIRQAGITLPKPAREASGKRETPRTKGEAPKSKRPPARTGKGKER